MTNKDKMCPFCGTLNSEVDFHCINKTCGKDISSAGLKTEDKTCGKDISSFTQGESIDDMPIFAFIYTLFLIGGGLFAIYTLVFAELDIIILDRIALLVQGLLCIVTALFLIYKKALGIKLVHLNCIGPSLLGLYLIVTNEIVYNRVKGLVLVIISYCIYWYFKKRKHMFTN